MNKIVQRLMIFVIFLMAFMLIYPAVVADSEEDPELNKEMLIAFHEAEANRDYSAMANYVTEDFVRHSIATSGIAPDVAIRSRDDYILFLQDTVETFPDYMTTPQILVAEDDYVAFYSLFTGTFIANGNRITMPVSGLVRFEDGLMAEMWVEWDNLTWDMQMNAVESPVESMDDLVGAWEIFVDGESYRLEYTAEGEIFVGSNPRVYRNISTGIYELEGNRMTDSTTTEDCDGVYATYVTRQANGIKRSLRFELVGEDCYESRREALAGQTIYPYSD